MKAISMCLFALSLLLQGCGKKQQFYSGSYKIGTPYVIKNVKYTPKKDDKYVGIGIASWYGGKFHGRKTANGEKFNKNSLTAAHKTLPLPCIVKVTNLSNNKSVLLMINDRGPFHKSRIIDVSARAAEELGFKNSGITNVKVVYMEKESKKLLNKLSLNGKHGSKANKPIIASRCSIDCYLKKINDEHKVKKFFPFIAENNDKISNLVVKQEALDTKTISSIPVLNENGGSKSISNNALFHNTKSKVNIGKVKLLQNSLDTKPKPYFIMIGQFKNVEETKVFIPKIKEYVKSARVTKMASGYKVKIGPILNLKDALEVSKKIRSSTGFKADIMSS